MTFRKDLPEITISVGNFQEFDHYKTIKQSLPVEWNLQAGDLIYWGCCRFDGILEIKEIKQENDKNVCSLLKIS